MGSCIDGIQSLTDGALGEMSQTIDRHETMSVEHSETIRRMETQLSHQETVVEQLRQEVVALRSAQTEAAATVREVRQEMAMPPDAPVPQVPRTGNAWDRQPDPTTLQANASGMLSQEALMQALAPLIAAVVEKPRIAVAKRWTIKVAGRDVRHSARRVGMLVAALRDGDGWRTVEVWCMCLPASRPRPSRWNLPARSSSRSCGRCAPRSVGACSARTGVVCVGYQKVVKVEAESSSHIELRFNDQAMTDHGLKREEVQRAWDAMSSGISVRWSP